MSDLNAFFEAVQLEKQKEESEIRNLISDSFDLHFLNPLQKKVIKKRKLKRAKKPDLIEKSLGLLAEPPSVKNDDPLTPLDKNFVTQEELQNHYRLFLSRIQQQLSTIGGGGEVNLAFMEMPQAYVTTASYIASMSDYYIGVNFLGAVTIFLPTPRKNGKIYIIKDELGEASKGENRYITIKSTGSDLFDNQDKVILAYDYGSLTLTYRDGWRII